MDHGARHPNMPKKAEDCFVLTCNVSLEYEKTEVNSSFFYKSADERQKLVAAERSVIDNRVKQVVCKFQDILDYDKDGIQRKLRHIIVSLITDTAVVRHNHYWCP